MWYSYGNVSLLARNPHLLQKQSCKCSLKQNCFFKSPQWAWSTCFAFPSELNTQGTASWRLNILVFACSALFSEIPDVYVSLPRASRCGSKVLHPGSPRALFPGVGMSCYSNTEGWNSCWCSAVTSSSYSVFKLC